MAALRYFFSLLMVPISFVTAGFSLIAYMAGQTDPNESIFITFIGLAIPVVLIINLGEFYQFNLSSCIRQQNSLTAQFVSFSLSNLANIFYPPNFYNN